MGNAKRKPPQNTTKKTPTKTKNKKPQKQRENGSGREGVGMAKVQGCCVSTQLSLREVRSLRTPSAGSRRRQSACRSWAAQGAEPRLRPATGGSGAAGRDVSHPEGWDFDFQVGWAGCGGRRAAAGAPGDTALLLPGLGRCPRAGGRAGTAPGHRGAGSRGDRRRRGRRSAPRGMPTSNELPFCLF